MQNWKFLMELECERELAKPWDREKAKNSTFVAPYVSPPPHFAIQGLKPPPAPSLAPKKRRCRTCEYYHRVGRYCKIKHERGFELKGYCPLDHVDRKDEVPENELCRNCPFLDKVNGSCLIQRLGRGICIRVKEQRAVERSFQKPSLMPEKPCRFCDYFDKSRRLCVLEAAGRSCIYVRPRSVKATSQVRGRINGKSRWGI
jgi:hypothetical protein